MDKNVINNNTIKVGSTYEINQQTSNKPIFSTLYMYIPNKK